MPSLRLVVLGSTRRVAEGAREQASMQHSSLVPSSHSCLELLMMGVNTQGEINPLLPKLLSVMLFSTATENKLENIL